MVRRTSAPPSTPLSQYLVFAPKPYTVVGGHNGVKDGQDNKGHLILAFVSR
jgi:hypothetical protein